MIKVSRGLKELSIAINKEKNDYYTKTGKEISMDDLSSKLNVSKYDLIMAMETSYLPASLEDTIYELMLGESSIHDCIIKDIIEKID